MKWQPSRNALTGVLTLSLGWIGAAPATTSAATPAVTPATTLLPLTPALTTLRVWARPAVPDLQCASVPRAAAPAAPAVQDPREIPQDDEVQAALKEAPSANAAVPLNSNLNPGVLGRARAGEPYRVAIWGDSHLAAGFFTQELAKVLQLAPEQIRSGFIPASMNRPGVRLPLRKTCVSPAWRYESAHANAASAAAPGPGLVSLFSAQAGASVAWDLRSGAGEAQDRQLRVLYQQTANPLRLAVSVDGGPEVELTLSGAPGPAVLELAADAPMSVVQLRLISGEMRLQGLSLPMPSQTALHMDVFGFPGATVAGWKQASTDDLSAWFNQTPYNLVILEFGTNEGNAKPFDALAYQATLHESVQRLRTVFPNAACVLIAPGDRGVLVRRSEKWRRLPMPMPVPAASGKTAVHKAGKKTNKKPGTASGAKPKTSNVQSPPRHSNKVPGHKSGKAVTSAPERTATGEMASAPSRDLMQYTRIHEEIGRIQNDVAQQQGCTVWSMLQAMGGQGSAYRWARQSPPLMARDLIHFTVPGYQQLARQFADDLGWNAAQLGLMTAP